MPLQYFLLDSTDGDHATRIAALATAAAVNQSYTPAIVQRPAAHDSNLVIVAANVTEGQLTGDLADLASGVYPNAICRHRWQSLTGLRHSGFHMIGESERSWEGVAGRVAVHIRPQTGPTGLSFSGGAHQVQTGGGYGDGTGLTDHDAANGPFDIVAMTDGGIGHVYETGKSYFYKRPHVRRGNVGNGGNYPFSNSATNSQGNLSVEDADGLGPAGAINFYYGGDSSPLGPGMFWGTFVTMDTNTSLPWEEYGTDSGIWVNGAAQGSSTGLAIGNGSTSDADVEDITVDSDTLIKRHTLKGKTTLADLDGTGGRGRYHAQTEFGQGTGNWDAVLFFDGVSTWTDLTAAANDATSDDWEAFPAGAADGAMLVLVRTTIPPGCLTINLSQVRIGGTVVPRYSLGSGVSNLGTFTNIIDPTVGLSSGLANQTIQFNPKADWATQTYAAGEAFETTGYGFVFVKTAGTITQAARGDQTQRQHRAVFVHRWNDETPTLGLCQNNAGATGLKHVLSGVGNVEFINARLATPRQWENAHVGAKSITLTGSQYLALGDMQTAASAIATTWRHSQTDKGQAIWWDRSDILVQNNTHALIQRVLANITLAESVYGTAGHEAVTAELDAIGFDPDLYRTILGLMPEWSDTAYCINGPYSNNGGAFNPAVHLGHRIRKVGMKHDTLNDSEVLDFFVNADPTDHHSDALRGGLDANSHTRIGLGFEEFQAAVELHPTSNATNDGPVGGDCNPAKNYRYILGYHYQHNGYFDGAQPAGGFKFSGNNEIFDYENGKTGNINNQVWFWAFDKLHDSANAAGEAFASNWADAFKARFIYFGKDIRWWWTATKSYGPQSTHVITFNGVDTYNDVTANLLRTSGGTPSALFPAGTTGNRFYVGTTDRFNRRFTFNFGGGGTVGVGDAVLTVRYWNGSAMTTVSNRSWATPLTAGSTLTFDRPADAAKVSLDAANGTSEGGDFAVERFYVEIEITSGSFSTIPQPTTVTSRLVGPAIDLQYYRGTIGSTSHGIGRAITNAFNSNSAHIIDKHGVIELEDGAADTDSRWKIGSTSTDTPNKALAAHLATTNSKVTSDAEIDTDIDDIVIAT